MKRTLIVLLGLISVVPAIPLAGNAFFLSFSVLPDKNSGFIGSQAVNYSGLSVVRDQFSGQIAYEMAGPDGPGIGRIYSTSGQPSYALTDIGSQFKTSTGINQSLLSIVECYQGQFGWDGPSFVAATRNQVAKSNILGSRLNGSSVILTQVPIPTLLQAGSGSITVQVPSYIDNGGQATGLQLWRQGSDGTWQSLIQLPLSPAAQTYVDRSVTAGASYWYGTSVVFGWPGGGGEGAVPNVTGQFVSQARSLSGLMVAAVVQPKPTPIPTLLAQLNHDLGQAGWAAGPNPSHDGRFRIQFHTDKPGRWDLRVFGLDGSLVKDFNGTAQQNGWQVAETDLVKQASGIYLMELRVTQEGETEKTLPIRKVAVIR